MAAELPPELQAAPTENAQTLQLAKIAGRTVQNDLIGRGDVLKVNISAGFQDRENPEWIVRVSEEAGTVVLPDLGPVVLEGFTLETAEARLGALCKERELYRSPQVTVTRQQP